MANLAYFADLEDGTTLEFRSKRERTGEDRLGRPIYRETAARVFYEGRQAWGIADDRRHVKITRIVEMKALPSRHECDSRCMNATGRVMKCECACGGRNHGRGAFVCEAD